MEWVADTKHHEIKAYFAVVLSSSRSTNNTKNPCELCESESVRFWEIKDTVRYARNGQ